MNNNNKTLGEELLFDIQAHKMGFETDDFCRGYDRCLEQFADWPEKIDKAIDDAYQRGIQDEQAK